MRRIFLDMDSEEFLELYSLAKSYSTASADPELPISRLMEKIVDQCEPRTTPRERKSVEENVAKVLQVFNSDSPDLYLLKAGMSGLSEQVNNLT